MKNIFLMLLVTVFCLPLAGQDISGIVVSRTNKPLDYANVVLMMKSDSTYLIGAATSADGHFNMTNHNGVSLSETLLKVSSIGYKDTYLPAVAQMDTIVLQEDVHELDDVVVTAKRPLIKMDGGKLKVSIRHSVLSNTGDAIQVLSHLPFINSTDDAISVFGRGTPLIYIDNRIIRNTDELHKLSGSDIKNVEIDLHPGAAYANHVKAVIKIATIRKGEGLSADIAVNANQRKHLRMEEFGKLNYRFKKWDYFVGVDAQQKRIESAVTNNIRLKDNDNTVDIEQKYNDNNRNKQLSANAGFSFSNDGKNDFGMRYEFERVPHNKENTSGQSTFSENGQTKLSEQVSLLNRFTGTEHSLNAYYITSWGKESKLRVNFDYLQGDNRTDYTAHQANTPKVSSSARSDYRLYAGKAEIFNPLWGGTLHYGAEMSYTDNTRQYYAKQNSGTALEESDDKNRQALYGIFVSQSNSFGPISMEAGGRFEITNHKYYHLNELQKDVSKHYTKLLPYLQLNYSKNALAMSLSYNSSIDRPSYGQLTASTIYMDDYTYKKGTPSLRSGYEHTLGFTFSWKDLIIGVSHIWHENRILQTLQKPEGQTAILMTVENMPDHGEWAANVSYAPAIGFWHPKIETNIFAQDLEYKGMKYNKPQFFYGVNNLFRLSKHVNLSVDLWGTTQGDLYLFTFRPTFRTDINLNAKLLKDKLSVWLSLNDLFHTDKNRLYQCFNGIHSSKDRKQDTRGIMLELRYSFNPQRNKYKGRSAGGSEIRRLKK